MADKIIDTDLFFEAEIMGIGEGKDVSMPGYDFVLYLRKNGRTYMVHLTGASDFGPASTGEIT